MRKILFVSNNNALNNSFGAEQRGNMLLKAFLANNFSVDFAYVGSAIETYSQDIDGVNVVFWNDGTQWSITSFAAKLRLLTYRMFPVSKPLSDIIESLERRNHYDYIICRYLQVASLAGLSKYAHKLILDVDDLPSQSFWTHIQDDDLLHSIYHKIMYYSMDKETRRWIRSSYVSLFPSERQAKQYGGHYFPNIPVISCKKTSFNPQNKNVLFIGRLDYDPNYNGLDAFISNSWDIVVEQMPDAKLIIAGKGLSNDRKDRWTKHRNVEVLGFVENLLSFYEMGNIVISPITVGAGTNIKVIEALSLGKACVLSQFSTKGFEDVIQPDINCAVYSNFKDCTSKLVHLLADSQACQRLSEKAFLSTKNKYSQDVLNTIIATLLKE